MVSSTITMKQDDDIASTSSATKSSLPSLHFVEEELSIPNQQTQSHPNIKIDEKHLRHVRSKEIDIILQCYYRNTFYNNEQRMKLNDGNKIMEMSTYYNKYNSNNNYSLSGNSSTGAVPFALPSLKAISSSLLSTQNTQHQTSISSFVVVTGPAGCGKTELIQYALYDTIQHTGGYYISGIFDSNNNTQQHHSSVPYCAYSIAITSFCYQLLQRNVPDTIRKVRDTIHTLISDSTEIYLLRQHIPALDIVLNYDAKNAIEKNDNNTIAVQVPATNDDTPDLTYSSASSSKESETTNVIDTSHTEYNDDIFGNIKSQVFRQNDNATTTTSSRHQQRTLANCLQELFVAIASSIEGRSIVLVLSDLHNADPCSVDFLCNLLSTRIPGLFIIGTNIQNMSMDCCRASASTCYLVQRIRDIEQSSNNTILLQTIPIRNLNYEQVQYVVYQTILSSTETKNSFLKLENENDCNELYDIFMDQTHGNIFLMNEFIEWLLCNVRKQPNSSSVWSIRDIYRVLNDQCENQKKKDGYSAIYDTKFYVSNKLETLPLPMIELLKVGACFGSIYIEEKLISYVLDFPIETIMVDAVNMNILVAVNGYESNMQKLYTFVHDEVKTGIYNLIPESSRELFHLEIGRRLWRRFDQNEIEHYLFVILYQLHIGCRLISRLTERHKIASLCLHAGRKAAKSSTFQVALVYLKFGIRLLGNNGWREEYDLSLMLHNAAAEMELCNANFEGMEILVKAIVKECRNKEDTIPAQTTRIHGLVINNHQHEGLDLGRKLLLELGHGFPKTFSRLNVFLAMKSVAKLLKGKNDRYLKNLPDMIDEKALAAMHILSLMFTHALLMRPEIALFIGIKMVELTIVHGLSSWSPLAFEAYGMLCMSVHADRINAFRFGQLGLELIEKLQVREYIPRVYAIYFYCIHPWRYPMRDALSHLLHAYFVGLQTGDIEFSAMCAVMWVSIAYDRGSPLDEIDVQCARFQSCMLSHRQTSLHCLILPQYYSVKYHRGEDADFKEIETIREHSITNEIQILQYYLMWYKAEIAFIYNDIEHADKFLSEVNQLDRRRRQFMGTPDVVATLFLNGMVVFCCLNPSHKHKRLRSRRQYLREGKAMLRELQVYAKWCPENYIAQKFLLEAELAAVNNQQNVAIEKYICAIALSKENRSLFVQALANERAGRYSFNILKQRHDATTYFKHALQLYREWNGKRKVEHLRAELLEMYGTAAFNQCR